MSAKPIARALCAVAVLATSVAVATPPAHAAVDPTPPGGAFRAVAPVRVLDTRQTQTSPKPAGSTLTAVVAGGVSGVPTTGAGAVTLNVTAFGASGTGWLTVYPKGAARPSTPQVRFVATRYVSNLVTVPVGTGGAVTVYVSAAAAHVQVDVQGWYTTPAATTGTAGLFRPLTPARLLDTRSGYGGTQIPAKGTLKLQVSGRRGVPSSGAGAVSLNATVVAPAAAGFLTMYARGAAKPVTKNLSFAAGQTVANRAVVRIGSYGQVLLYNGGSSPLHVLVDTGGWFTDATADPTGAGYFVPVPSKRTYDTGASPLGTTPRTVKVTGVSGVPTTNVVAVALTTTVSGPTATGNLRVYPAEPAPGTNDQNYVKGLTIASHALARTSATGTVQLRNSAGTLRALVDTAGYFVRLPAPAFASTSPLPAAVAGTPYEHALAATGGTAPYAFTLASGTLPAGLTLSPAGNYSGTPTTPGTYSFALRVTDAFGSRATKSFTHEVAAGAFTITTASPLPGGTVGTAYSRTLTTANGAAPVTFEVSDGALPAGLALSAAGVLSGTPTTAEATGFTVTATDAEWATATKAFSLTVAPSPTPTVATTSLPAGRVGAAYTASLAATGGTGPYTWTTVAGALPPGIALSAAGVLSGTPTSAGTSTATFRVTDAANATADRPLGITVTDGSDWTQAHYDMGRTGYAPQETAVTAANAASLRQVWALDAGAGSSAVAGGVLYTAGTLPDEPSESALTAYDMATSAVLWRVQLHCGAGQVAVTATAVLILCDARLRAYERGGSHALLWDTAVTDPGNGNVVDFAVMGDRVVAVEPGAVYGYSLASGTRLWRQLLPSGASGNQVAVSGTTAVVAMGDRLRSYATGNGALGWTVTGSAFSVVADGSAVYAVVDGELRRLALATGTQEWATTTGASMDSVLGSGGGKVLALWRQTGELSIETKTQAYHAANGTPAWEASTPNRILNAAITPSLAWLTSADYGGMFGSDTGAVTAVSMADGEVVRTLDTGRRIFSATAVSDGRLVVARSTSLRVYGLDRPIPVIATKVLRSGHVGTPYQDALAATSGIAPYAWSITQGTLPTGLSLAANGTISGTPTAASATPVTARVTDAAGATATRRFVVQVSPTGAGAWPTVGGNDARTGLAATETTIGLDSVAQLGERWASSAHGTAEAGDLAVHGDFVYVTQWYTGTVLAYRRTGTDVARTPAWTATTDEPDQHLVQTGITVAQGHLLVGTLQGLYSFDPATGAKRWRAPYSANNPGGSAPVVIGTRVFVGDGDGGLHGFDLATGAPAWAQPFAPTVYPHVPLTIDGVATDGTRLFAASACVLYAVAPATGAVLWHKVLSPSGNANCAYAYRSIPLVANGIVYAGSQVGTMAFDAATGDVVWSRNLGSGGSMALSNGALLLGADENGSWVLRAVDPLTGALLWRSITLTGPPRVVVAGDLVLATTSEGLGGVDIRTGEAAWTGTPSSGNAQPFQPAVVDGTVYHVGYDRKLRAYGVPA